MEESGVPVYLPTSQAKAGGFRFSVFVTKVLLRPRSPPQVIPPSLLSRKPPRCTRDMHPKGAIRTLHLYLPEADIRRIKKKKSATIKAQFRGSERRRRPDCHETAGFCANALRDETGPPRSGARSEDSETFRSLPNLLRSSPAWCWGPAHVGGMAALIYGIGAWAEATACSRASSHAAWSLASWAPTRLSTWGAVSWGRGLQRRCLGTAGSSGARGKAVFSRPPGTDVCPGSRGGGCHCTRVWCTLRAFKRRPRGEGARSLRGSRKGRCGFTSKQ